MVDDSVSTYRKLALSMALSYILFILTSTFYDVFLGPLSKVPGPKLAAATRLVYAYHRIVGNGERWLSQLHQQYGDVVRPAPREVSLASGNNWKSIYGHQQGSNKAAMLKDAKFYHRDIHDIHIGSVADAEHARHRKVFSYAFSDRALSLQEPLVQQYIDQLISNLRRKSPTEKVDMVENFNFTTFDIMADLTFGEPLGCLQNSKYSAWVSMIFSSLTIITFLIEINHSPYLRAVFNAILPASAKAKAEAHFQHSVDRVNRRLASNLSRPDIIGLVQKADLKDDESLSMDEIHANAQLLMLAGTETTATCLSGLTYYLLMHPDKMTRLTNEIRSSFASDHQIDFLSASKLPYLNSCIQEALRIYPPVPMGLPRVVGRGGIELDGFFIPENTSIYNHMYSTFRNANNFAYPDTFAPERWLKDEAPKEFNRDKRSSLQPFSVGPRNCLGINLAYLEIRLILVHLLYNFDLEPSEDLSNWPEQRTFCLWEKHPLMVTLQNVSRS